MELLPIGINPGEVTITWGYISGAKCARIETNSGFGGYIPSLSINNEVVFEIDAEMSPGTTIEYIDWYNGCSTPNLDWAKQWNFDGQITLNMFRVTRNGQTTTITGTFNGNNAKIMRGVGGNSATDKYTMLQADSESTATGLTINAPNLGLSGSATMSGKVEFFRDTSYMGNPTVKRISVSTLNSNPGFEGSVQLTIDNVLYEGSLVLDPGGHCSIKHDIQFGQSVLKHFGMNSDPNSFINSIELKVVGSEGIEIEKCFNLWADNFLLYWNLIPPNVVLPSITGAIGIDGGKPTIKATSDGGQTWEQIYPIIGGGEPYADAGGSYGSNPGVPIAFDFSGCSDSDGTVEKMKVDWDGDGTWDTGTAVNRWIDFNPDPTHTYNTEDIYTLRLQVRDNDLKTSNIDTASVTISTEEGFIDGYVYDNDGDLIYGAEIITDHGDYIDYTDSNGYYHMTVVTGTYYVQASHDDYTEQVKGPFAVNPDQTTTVDPFYLELWAKLTGYVRDTYGTGIDDATVTILETGSHRTTMSNGLYYWSEGTIDPDPYTIRAEKTGYETVTVTKIVNPGANSLNFELTQIVNPPTVSTMSALNVEDDHATLRGSLSNMGGAPQCDVWFQYGTTTNYGQSTTPQTVYSTGNFQRVINGLNPSTTYHYRAYASNNGGTSYGYDQTFTTTTCFLAGTKITMADGTFKNIEDVQSGEKVKAYDEETNTVTNAEVVGVFHHSKDQANSYYLLINDKLKVTTNHPMYVNNIWTNADQIKIGDLLQDMNGQEVPVFSIYKVFDKQPTYNLKVDKYHTYYAEGVLVHNKDPPNPIWVRPNAYYPSSDWNEVPKAYDPAGTSTYAYSDERGILDDWEWTDWITLTTPLIECNKIRYYAFYDAGYVKTINVDVYYNGGWHDVDYGSFPDRDYKEASLDGTFQVSKVRIKFYLKGCLVGTTADLHDFQFWDLNG